MFIARLRNAFVRTNTRTNSLRYLSSSGTPSLIIDLNEEKTNTSTDENVSFARLFRKSKFVKLGDLRNRVLVGKITNIIGDDLYIDYGGKFECVCKRPEKNAEKYLRNEQVKIRLREFEMASHFLGAVKHITLLESDADLIGLYRPYVEVNKEEVKQEQR